MNNPPTIAIDLGTANIRVGFYVNEEFKLIPSEFGETSTPAFVAFRDTEIVVGKHAKDQLVLDPKITVYDIKRIIGRRNLRPDDLQTCELFQNYEPINYFNHPLNINNKIFNLEQVYAIILGRIKKNAEEYLKVQHLSSVVITVPANFDECQKKCTYLAAYLAGFNSIRLVADPVCEVIYYSTKEPSDSGRNFLILDIGAGSCEASILFVEGKICKVISTHELPELCGKNLTDCMNNRLLEECKIRFSENFTENLIAMKRLRNASEQAVKVLSDNQSYSVILYSFIGGQDFVFEIKRSQFEDWCENLTKSVPSVVYAVLDKGCMKIQDIQCVLFAGESCRIPKIRQKVTEIFGNNVDYDDLPEEAILCGALKSQSSFKVSQVLLDTIKCNLNEKVEFIFVENNKMYPERICTAAYINTCKNLQVSLSDSHGIFGNFYFNNPSGAYILEIFIDENGVSSLFLIDTDKKRISAIHDFFQPIFLKDQKTAIEIVLETNKEEVYKKKIIKFCNKVLEGKSGSKESKTKIEKSLEWVKSNQDDYERKYENRYNELKRTKI